MISQIGFEPFKGIGIGFDTRTIQKKLLSLLQKHGVTKIEFPDNRLIVGLCEVVETEADSNRKNDEIISIIRNGYIRGKELIRPAQIIVVKN